MCGASRSITGVLLPMIAMEDYTLFQWLIYLSTAVLLEGQVVMEVLGVAVFEIDMVHEPSIRALPAVAGPIHGRGETRHA